MAFAKMTVQERRDAVKTFNLSKMPPFRTEDGSMIRELAGPQPSSGASAHQSLAEATVPPGGETAEHYHPCAEEIYYITAGHGRMRLGNDTADVAVGDAIVIAPGTPHKLWAADDQGLVLLCCCSPPYAPEDTVLTGR